MEERRCNVCGSVVAPGDTFCQNCGSPLEAVAPEVPKETAAPEEPKETAAPGVQQETTVSETTQEPASQEGTTVLSGNPFHTVDPAPAQETVSNTGYQSTYTGVDSASQGVYQQTTDSSVNGTYGTYNAAYTANYSSVPEQPAGKAGKVCGIIGLILSIIGLLSACCFGGFIFGTIGIILCIICLVKKGSKGLGITGIIIGAVALLISLFTVTGLLSTPSILEDMGITTEDDNDYDFDNYDYDDYSYDTPSGTNQISVDGHLYTMPGSMSSMGLSLAVNYEDTAEAVSEIENDGLAAGDYKFVVFDSDFGGSFWGFLENTTNDTIYNVDELQVTGINVDNYTTVCTATDVEAYGGITLGMSRSDVEASLGEPDDTKEENGEEEGVYYQSSDGLSYIYLEYDDYDYVECVEVTMY